jgi:uroporphyrinogen-III synthase
MRRLFILRPEPGASASAERARRSGLDPVVAPLFRIVAVDWEAPDPSEFDALLLTSANAVRCAGEQLSTLRRLPVHAVGEATAAEARESGLTIASTGEAGAEELLRLIPPNSRLLHLCGAQRRVPEDAPESITPLVVYRAQALPRPATLDGLQGQVAAVHSPRAAARLSDLADGNVRGTVRIAAISRAAAAAAGHGWEQVEAAGEPSEAALLALAARLCQKDC